MDILEYEMREVKRLGDSIGYGNMIECAGALLNELVPSPQYEVSSIYEEMAKKILGKETKE